jgi:DNA-binding NarL/FixJ family response regulator
MSLPATAYNHPTQRVSVPDDHLVVVSRLTRVVVALEQQLFAEVLRVALTDRGGYDVVGTCASLSGLRAAVERTQPDVVLMDVESRGCDGVAVLREIRAALPSAAVLVLSASASPEILSEVMTAGAAGFLSFESDMADVITAVSQAADGQVVLSGRRLEALVRHLARRATPAPPSGPGGRLTEREHEVLLLLAQGASTPAIASALLISGHTARTHVQNVLVKLCVHSRLEAAAYAVRHGLVPSG